MNCNHIFHKSCTITITSLAQSKSTQETSLAITIKKQVLHNQETSFCNHNSEAQLLHNPAGRRSHQLGAAAPRASGRLCAPHRARRPRSPGWGDRPAPGGRAPPPRAGRPRTPPRAGRPLDLLHPAPARPARWPAAVPVHSPRKLLPGEEREAVR